MGQVINVWHVRMRKTCGIEAFKGNFQTARQRMFEGQRVKPRNQFRLTGQDAFLGIAPRSRPSAALDAGEWRSRCGIAENGYAAGDCGLSISPTVAQRTAQVKLLIETVVKACREHIEQDLLKVLLSQ